MSSRKKSLELNAEGYLDPFLTLEPDDDTFTGRKDVFGGVTIDTDVEKSEDEDAFERKLVLSLAKLKQSGIRGVWLRISINNSSFIPVAVKHGFIFHHTYPHHIILTQWLPETEPNTLPPFATSYIEGRNAIREIYTNASSLTQTKTWYICTRRKLHFMKSPNSVGESSNAGIQPSSDGVVSSSTLTTAQILKIPSDGWGISLEEASHFTGVELDKHIASSSKIMGAGMHLSLPTGLAKAKTHLQDDYLHDIQINYDQQYFFLPCQMLPHF
ncbi:uncharacterized protein LOC114948627 isoform X2 [Acropora millepora]|uniref:uncharacterized protein LOC114948627 isoform X2 n=1 Tax=Acropora millepora TaxID=45264 RepID=UPI001CF1FD52|nr:uncharacterized protein LOC114948627 isoform X2 [Acropora millepora]